VHLDGGRSQEPLGLAGGELHQPIPLGVLGPLFRRELKRPGRVTAVVFVPQAYHSHVLVQPVRVPDEEVAQAGQGAGLETLGHVTLQTRTVGRRQVRVSALVRETTQPVEQVLAAPVPRAGARLRPVVRDAGAAFALAVWKRHGLLARGRCQHEHQYSQRAHRSAVARLHRSSCSVVAIASENT